MSVESIKGDVLEQLLNQTNFAAGNGRTTLESFGFFLETYVIQGAEITLDPRNPRRFTLSEAIISIDDGLYRVSTETLTLKGRGTTYFVDFTVKNGFVVNVQHPSGSFLALWEINTNASGNIVSTVDMRGEMGSIRFKEDMLGIITDQIIVDEQHILNQAVGTTKIKDKAVTTEKYADKSITKEKIAPSYNASDLPYEGLVLKDNVKDAIDDLKVVLGTVSSGDSGVEAKAARVDSVMDIVFDSLKDRLDNASLQVVEIKNSKADKVELNKTNSNIEILGVTKADQSFVDAQFASIVSGAPKGTYPTLSALQSAYPSGSDGIFLVLADGHWYYWNRDVNIWVDGGVYQATELPNGSVEPVKTTFMVMGRNLFDKSKGTPNMMVNFNTGTIQSNISHFSSNYVEVEPNTSYVINQEYNVAFYDSSKVFLSDFKIDSTQPKGKSFLTPTICKYIRFSVRDYTVNPNLPNVTMLEMGTVSTEFEPYNVVLTEKYIPIVSTEKCDFFINGKNMYDKSKAKDGYLINGNDAGKEVVWATHSASNYIDVSPNLNYVWSVNCNYAFYDAEKNFISGKNSLTVGETVVSPTKAKYVRFSINLDTTGIKDICQLEQNIVSTSYEPYLVMLDPEYINLQNVIDKFKNLKWNALGDSITAAGKYQYFTQTKIGFSKTRNYGVGGTKIADTTGSDANAFVNRFISMDPDADVITVMGGTNDWGQNVIISNSNKYDKSTLTGAIRTIIEGLIAKYPGKYIIWATLPQRNNITYPEGVNANGDTTQAYATAIQNVCKEYAVPCIDVHNECGINKFNMDSNGSFMPDRVHPSDLGYQRIAALYIDMFNKSIY